jgi:hypothetical protein
MIRQSLRDLFPIDSHEFQTRSGNVFARVTNNLEAAPSTGGFSDQTWFLLEFSKGKRLTLVLSDAALHPYPDGRCRVTTFQIVEDWLAHEVVNKIEFYGGTNEIIPILHPGRI